MARIICLAWLALSLWAQASVTVGWKVPIEFFAPDYETSSLVRKLEQPPGESPFFRPGDVLWDVSKARSWPTEADPFEPAEADPFEPADDPGGEAGDWKGDWAVWNARSGMVVARGSWEDIQRVERGIQFAGRPFVIRSTIHLARGGKGEERFSILSRSGEEASLLIDDIHLKIAATTSGSRTLGIADLAIAMDWPGDVDKSRWKLATNVTLLEGRRTLLARQGTGENAWEISLTVVREPVRGASDPEPRWIEMAGKLEPWRELPLGLKTFRKRLDDDRIVGMYPLDLNRLGGLGWLGGQFQEVPVPKDIGDLIEGPVLNMAGFFRDNGVDTKREGFLAGYHPPTSKLVVIGDSETQDLCEGILPGYCGLPGILWISTNESFGGWALTSRSGERASIVRSVNGKDDVSFEIEPILGGNGQLIDLSLKADILSGSTSRGRLESNLTLWVDQPLTVARHTSAKGEDIPVEIRFALLPYEE